MRFRHDGTEAAATKMATHLGDKTETTRAVAAFGDLHKRIVTRRGQHAWSRFVIKVSCALVTQRQHRQRTRVYCRIANSQDVVDLAGADERVDLRHLCFQFVAITLDQTTGYDQALRIAAVFHPGSFKYGVNRFLFCGINKPARVYDQSVRFVCVGSDLITVLLKLAHHHLAVDEVLRATETNKSNFIRKSVNGE